MAFIRKSAPPPHPLHCHRQPGGKGGGKEVRLDAQKKGEGEGEEGCVGWNGWKP